tara:strand:- start:1799 stop:2029 length:231 start_codon:yes stop_codon:yes gene_type:complete
LVRRIIVPRKIRIGDKVQGFLRPEILGEVVKIYRQKTRGMSVDGTLAASFEMCEVKVFKTQKILTAKSSDLFIVDY